MRKLIRFSQRGKRREKSLRYARGGERSHNSPSGRATVKWGRKTYSLIFMEKLNLHQGSAGLTPRDEEGEGGAQSPCVAVFLQACSLRPQSDRSRPSLVNILETDAVSVASLLCWGQIHPLCALGRPPTVSRFARTPLSLRSSQPLPPWTPLSLNTHQAPPGPASCASRGLCQEPSFPAPLGWFLVHSSAQTSPRRNLY